jgi:hypothetical protein
MTRIGAQENQGNPYGHLSRFLYRHDKIRKLEQEIGQSVTEIVCRSGMNRYLYGHGGRPAVRLDGHRHACYGAALYEI